MNTITTGGDDVIEWQIYILKFWTPLLPLGPFFFILMQFSAKFGQKIGWRPLLLWAWCPPSVKSLIRSTISSYTISPNCHSRFSNFVIENMKFEWQYSQYLKYLRCSYRSAAVQAMQLYCSLAR